MNPRIPDLISPEILDEIQRSFVHKHDIGVCIYDEHSRALNRSYVNLPALAKLSPVRQQLFRIFYRFENLDTAFSHAHPRPIHRSFCQGLIIRSIFPLLFKNQIAGFGCLLHFSRQVDPIDDQFMITSLERLENEPERLNDLLDTNPVFLQHELSLHISEFQNILQLFLEAGAARINLAESNAMQTGAEAKPSTENISNPSLVTMDDPPLQGIFFCTTDGRIIDALPAVADILGYGHPGDLCDLSLTDDLVFRKDDKTRIRQLLQDCRSDLFDVAFYQKNQLPVTLKLQMLPQQDGDSTLGYECRLSTLPAPQSHGQEEVDRDQSAIGLITDHLQHKEEHNSVSDDLLNWENEESAPQKRKTALHKDTLLFAQSQRDLSGFSFKSMTPLFNAVPAPLAIIDADDTIQVWNPAMERLLGIPASSALNSQILDLIVSNSHSMWSRWRQHLLSQTEVFDLRPKALLPLIKKDTSVLMAKVRMSRLSLSGKIYFSLMIEKNEAGNEQSLESAPGKTAASAKSTEPSFPDLSELQSHYKKVRLQFADIAEALADNVSKVYIESLRNEESKNKYAALRRISDISVYIDRQLAYFTEENTPKFKTVNLNTIISEIGARLQQFLPHTIELQTFFDHHLPMVHADADLLIQVLGALCKNAAEAMPNGGTLTLTTTNDASWIDVKISDTGAGISEHIQEHLFHPFFTTKGKALGKGLGLCAAYGIAGLHHASITLASRHDSGTTVTLRLPIHAGTNMQNATKSGDCAKATILVIDDAADIAEATGIALNRAGYAAVVCTTCEQGRQMFTNHAKQIDLVILDFQLDNSTGLDCAQKIMHLSPDLPILFYSGTDDAELARFIQETGSGWLRKPCKTQDIVTQVELLLKKKKSG
jgi:nitrogen-specific signal transduction histidine kinase/CheY-like chemotaxis protein